jgi:hypothetical protein
VFGGVHGGLLGRVLHGAGGDLLELLRQRTPPLQRIDQPGRRRSRALASALAAERFGVAADATSEAIDAMPRPRPVTAPATPETATRRAGRGIGDLLHARHDGVSRLELEGIGHVAHVEVHALERGQRHLLHLQRLDGGLQRHGVLVKPELHRLELLDALVQLFHVERGRHPVAKVGHLGNVLRGALGQVLQKVKTGDELAETKTGGIAHGLLHWCLC